MSLASSRWMLRRNRNEMADSRGQYRLPESPESRFRSQRHTGVSLNARGRAISGHRPDSADAKLTGPSQIAGPDHMVEATDCERPFAIGLRDRT